MEPLRFAGVDGTGDLAPPSVIEDEFAKDRWDARHTGCYYMDFVGIAETFCSYVKDYARVLIAAARAVKTIATHMRYVRQFVPIRVPENQLRRSSGGSIQKRS